jgi:hypothetical protein
MMIRQRGDAPVNARPHARARRGVKLVGRF